jgi:hypothetical protein
VEAKAQMKYHHLERCFTYRMKRPMVQCSLRAVRRLGLGLWVLRTFTSGFGLRTSSGVPREDPTVETLCTNPCAFGCSESLVSRHLPDGEFGWGGISVTQQRRCPKASSVGTEISRGTQASRLA